MAETINVAMWMNFLLLFTAALISAAAQQIFYVLPDDHSIDTCHSFQPCATLSQYLLDNNGSLPVVTNVEYHFLPGEHLVPINMTLLTNLTNFVIVGRLSNNNILSVLDSWLSDLVILNSVNVTITNVILKTSIVENEYHYSVCTYGLVLENCSFCKLIDVTCFQFGLTGNNLAGKTYLTNLVIDFGLCNIVNIVLDYRGNLKAQDHDETLILMDNVFVKHGYKNCIGDGVVSLWIILISLYSETLDNIKIVITNSNFRNICNRILYIVANKHALNNTISIKNSTFENNINFHTRKLMSMISIEILHRYMTITFSNCQFYANVGTILISVKVNKHDHCKILNNPFCTLSSIIKIEKCTFGYNSCSLMKLFSTELLPCVNVYINGLINIHDNDIEHYIYAHFENLTVHINGPISVSNNDEANTIMSVKSADIIFNGPIIIRENAVGNIMMFKSSSILFNGILTVSNNKASIMQMHSSNVSFNGSVTIDGNQRCDYIMQFQFSDVLFGRSILILSNFCKQIITLKSHHNISYIKVMEYSNITFVHNNYSNLIAVETGTDYNNPYPFCLFQYVSLQNTSAILSSHYIIIISDNFQYKCESSMNYLTVYCKWIPTAVFNGHNAVDINRQIIQSNQKHQRSVSICSNFNKYTIGPVYPGQKLLVEFCMPCSGNNSVLYAETHSTHLPESACKITHQTELINYVFSKSIVVSYTIVSGRNDSCKLFLTVSPFLYHIYEVFDVQLLPCPIGFTLQNGVCDCDPLLPADIYTCYIDQAAIRSPANTWINYTQSRTSKYIISDCPIDYCLPFSSNVNLLHPDTQCQFNRTGILCSQCQHPFSMVFASSRCTYCTNAYIFISIIVMVAGIVLVVLLYFLNLTVTKATISGIILYANVISINDSIFLINGHIFKPLQIFISFANLDIGIETCFYNGMDSYAKMWLQLFFPAYLIIIAASIIIASRYSTRILRLTYRRSLHVLATLFLLSYTSILRTTLRVLFSYSTITYVPTGHQEVVWSVDASVPLFGLKFTLLFITCLVLFIILLAFNIILLFTRCLVRFKLINHFKPILDALQGPYKDRYYYWVAVHIILRCLFCILYAFPMQPRLLLATLILVPFMGAFGYLHPNKSKLINFQEFLLLINLTIIHAVSYYSSDIIFHFVTNLFISLAFIQLCIIIIYHFLIYTCHCNIGNTLLIIKVKLMKYCRGNSHKSNIILHNIPECTYNYREYQDGLVSDDFSADSS